MGVWDFIRSKLFGKSKALPEAESQTINVTQQKVTNVNSGNFNNFVKLDYTPQAKTIEYALQQYISGLLFQHESGRTFNSYSVLTSLCGMDTSNPGNNLQNEMDFINKLGNRRGINVINQPSGNGGVCFRHIQHGRNASNTDTRLYINCKRENIAQLANKFYEELGDMPYYFKFCSDEQAASKRRSEQFVFYLSSEPEEMNRIVQAIERTRQKNPKLFEGSRNMNPFMKDINGYIGYAPDVNVDVFENLNGEKSVLSAKSYNTLLSEILTDSFTNAIRDVVSHDYELSLKTGGERYDRATPYIRDVLKDIYENPEHQRKLIEKMKANLEISSQKNPLLNIRGIGKNKKLFQELSQ